MRDHKFICCLQVLLAAAVMLRFIEEYKNAHCGNGILDDASASTKVQVVRDGDLLQVEQFKSNSRISQATA